MKYRIEHFYKRIKSLTPREIISKVYHKSFTLVRDAYFRLSSHLISTHISETAFKAAIKSDIKYPDNFLDYVKNNQNFVFFISKENKEVLIDEIRSRFPSSEEVTIKKGDEICDHFFDLLGSGPTALGNPINWHLDFISKKEYPPSTYYKDIKPADYPGGHDIKVPWELSRCQHFIWLGQAYWFSGNEKYAEEFVNEVTDWIDKNPPRMSVNWVTAMDVAIRAVNWLWGYFFFIDSPRLTDEFLIKFQKSLLSHGRHIMGNLENSGVPNNHYLSNLAGLIFLGVLLPQFKESEKWLSFALRELESQTLRQVRDDGVDFESSTSYHRLVTEIVITSVVLAKLNGYEFKKAFNDRLEKMIEFIMYITKPDGSSPLLGDIDNGRLQRLKIWGEGGREWVDYRYLLGIGAVLFNRVDFAYLAGDQWQEAIWLLGRSASLFLQQSYSPIALDSHGFLNSGVFVFRASDTYLIVNAGPIGQKKIGGHAHNDALSFELYASGQTWVVDPGTYVYTSNQSMRNLFRSTSYHSTVAIDGQEINRIEREIMFEIGEDAETHIEKWITSNIYDYLRVSHNGYKRLKESVIHQRAFFFDKVGHICFIRDKFKGKGSHKIEWNWPIPPGLMPIKKGNEYFIRNMKGNFVKIIILSNDDIDTSIDAGMISPSYGSLLEGANFIKFITKTDGKEKYQFAFIPVCNDNVPNLNWMDHAQTTFDTLDKE